MPYRFAAAGRREIKLGHLYGKRIERERRDPRDPQRRQHTPFGHRNSSRIWRHSASVSNASISLGSVILAVFVMARPKKRANELTDKELVKRLFPKDVRKELKRVLAELNAEPPKRKWARKVSAEEPDLLAAK